MFEKRLVAGWGDIDFKSHTRNAAVLDKSADVRMMFFSENGLSLDEFIRRKIGPVILKDEVEYFKEIRLWKRFQQEAGHSLPRGSTRPDSKEIAKTRRLSLRAPVRHAVATTASVFWSHLIRRCFRLRNCLQRMAKT